MDVLSEVLKVVKLQGAMFYNGEFLLGHLSVETTECYLGSRQRLVSAVNDKIGLEPDFGPIGELAENPTFQAQHRYSGICEALS